MKKQYIMPETGVNNLSPEASIMVPLSLFGRSHELLGTELIIDDVEEEPESFWN